MNTLNPFLREIPIVLPSLVFTKISAEVPCPSLPTNWFPSGVSHAKFSILSIPIVSFK